MTSNSLYYGDNLDILRRYVQAESVDLIYLDPPFKSNQTYNILFQEKDGSKSASQIKAFEDTWHWDEQAARSFEEVVESGGHVAEAMQAFRKLLGGNDMLAYLSMMTPRLVELRRVLKPTGSIYLHCDSAASHYLKILMDAVFGPDHFQNEIVWQKVRSSKAQTIGFGSVHDTIFAYRKSGAAVFMKLYTPLSDQRVARHYGQVEADTGRRYGLYDFTQSGQGKPLIWQRSNRSACWQALDLGTRSY